MREIEGGLSIGPHPERSAERASRRTHDRPTDSHGNPSSGRPAPQLRIQEMPGLDVEHRAIPRERRVLAADGIADPGARGVSAEIVAELAGEHVALLAAGMTVHW